MPDPFRHYEGVPVLDLPADPAAPEDAAGAADGPEFVSQLLFHSAAVSASKRALATGDRYALRVNPSSGNLHPTEFHFVTRGLAAWPDGLYHYRPSSHMAEQRATGHFDLGLAGGDVPITFILTSVAWREAWKYRARAYRYCLHDMGHAWQSLALAVRAMRCESFAIGHFPDDRVAQVCGLHPDEWPMLVVRIHGARIPVKTPDSGDPIWYGGLANTLSEYAVEYPAIDAIHTATKLFEYDGIRTAEPAAAASLSAGVNLPPPAVFMRPFSEVVRSRRSALDFRGGSMSLEELSAILGAAAQPFEADFAPGRFIQLYLYAHRVRGLDPGVYRYRPESAKLELIRSGDQRVAAAGLSLGQDLAGNACVAFSMMADLERAGRSHGDRGYRYAHFEAGGIGQRLYLAAEGLGLGATGIGAFYDDQVHRYLGIESQQVVYHFAIGHPIPDPRLEA